MSDKIQEFFRHGERHNPEYRIIGPDPGMNMSSARAIGIVEKIYGERL